MKERMIAALAAALVALSPAGASAQSSPAEQIAAVQTEAMRGFLAASPETATFLGDYSYDGEWSDPTPAGIAKFKAMLASYEQRVDAIDVTGATLQDRNDIKLMKAFATSQNRQLADQEAGKDPSGPPLTMLGAVFTMILHKEGQDPTVWWDHMISRLGKAPAVAGRAASADHASGTTSGGGRGQAAGDGTGTLQFYSDADGGRASRRPARTFRQGARRYRRSDDGVDDLDECERRKLAGQLRDGGRCVQRDAPRRAAASLRRRSDRGDRPGDARCCKGAGAGDSGGGESQRHQSLQPDAGRGNRRRHDADDESRAVCLLSSAARYAARVHRPTSESSRFLRTSDR